MVPAVGDTVTEQVCPALPLVLGRLFEYRGCGPTNVPESP